MEIGEDFDEQFTTTTQRKTLKIIEDFACEYKNLRNLQRFRIFLRFSSFFNVFRDFFIISS